MEQNIPKIIHYCWFGGNELPPLAKKCIDSWKKYCPDYEIVEWNESNYNITNAPLYVRQAYELKKWAFTAGITKNITFHTGRHTFATMMLSLGADIYTVSKLLGHKELATTQIYAKVLDKRKQDAVSLIPNLGEK